MTAYLLSDDCLTTAYFSSHKIWISENYLISDELGIGSRQKHIGNFNQDHFHAVKYNSDVGSIYNLDGKQ